MFPVTFNTTTQLMRYVSPRTGVWYDYAWQPGTERWFCAESPHFVEELLVRELMYACKGVPEF